MSRYNRMMRGMSRVALLGWLLSAFLCVFLLTATAYSRDISFVWSANPETIDGYRIYYKTGSSGAPYDGAGATEGASPVDVGNVTSYTITGLSDTETYYFALTAYLGSTESGYSTEIVLGPTGQSTGRTVVFAWSANPETVDGYRLYYKTGSSGAPYNGTGATEGASPVDVGNVTTYSLSGLSSTETYYFVLTAYVGSVESTNTAELVLAPSQTNSPPTAVASNVQATEDAVFSGQLSGSDADNDPLTFTLVSGASKGSVVITDNTTGAFTYTPNANANGTDSFTFKVNDGTVDSSTAAVNVSIAAVNDPPTVSGTAVNTTEDASVSSQLSGTDVDGDGLTFSIVSNGSNGTATITNSSSGAFTYVPQPNANGSDSFTFLANDGTANSGVATVSVTISPVNDAPVASSASFTVAEDSSKSGQLSASDPDGDNLTFTIVTNGSKGNATITNPSTGAFTYTPNANATGADQFTFRVNDGTANSASATVSMDISAVNDPPVANATSIATQEDNAISGQLSGSDPDGDSLTFSIVTNGSKGNVVITNPANGAFTYTPDTSVNGNDSFTFRVSDGIAFSAAATVSVSIGAVNDPPVATASSLVTNEDSGYSGQLSGTDADGDNLTFSIVTNGSLGSAVITNSSSGAYNYTPNTDANGNDTFSFKVNDGTVDSAPATVNVTINAVNDPPVAMGDAIITDENTAYTGQLSGTDPDTSDSLVFSIVTGATKGVVAITDAATGAFTYTPNSNVYGGDTFTYKINDGTVDSAEATVNVTINLLNEIPVVADINLTTDRNIAITDRLLAHDPDGDALTYSIVSNGTKGVAAITNATTGTFTYTPSTDVIGKDSFTFKVNDGLEDSIIGTVDIEIIDEDTVTAVFGDNYGADYPGTVSDTFAKANNDINVSAEQLQTYSFATAAPHKIANTIVMKVDLSNIPTYATVVEAKLILDQTAATGAAMYRNSVHKITGVNPVITEVTGFNASNGQPWTAVASGTTYNDVPMGVADIGPEEDNQLLFDQSEYRSWMITNMVQEWIAQPSTNYGLLLKGEETAVETGRVFASSENTNAAIRPQVIVRYKLIPRAPSMISVEEIK